MTQAQDFVARINERRRQAPRTARAIGVLMGAMLLLSLVGATTAAIAAPREYVPRPPFAAPHTVENLPELRLPLIDKASHFIEWALNIQFTAPQREQFRGIVLEYWRTNDTEEIASTILAAKLYVLLPYLDETERQNIQRIFKETILESLYADQGRPDNQWLLRIYRSRFPNERPPRASEQEQVEAAEEYLKYQNRYGTINSMMNNMFR